MSNWKHPLSQYLTFSGLEFLIKIIRIPFIIILAIALFSLDELENKNILVQLITTILIILFFTVVIIHSLKKSKYYFKEIRTRKELKTSAFLLLETWFGIFIGTLILTIIVIFAIFS